MLAYEREPDSALVIGAGVPRAWLAGDGMSVRGLSTRWGTLSYTAKHYEPHPGDYGIELQIAGGVAPPGGVEIQLERPWAGGQLRQRSATVNGQRIDVGPGRWIRVKTLPATIRWVSGSMFY
jgi:hypothetical protein